MEIEMVALKQGRYGKTGVDVWDWHDMNRADPIRYMMARMLGNASRTWRRKMYFSMLKQGMWAQNDKLVEYARSKYQLFVLHQRETVSEPAEGLLEPSWDKEKAQKERQCQYRLVRFYHAMLMSKRMYKQVEDAGDGHNKHYVVTFPETQKSIIGALTYMLAKYSQSGRWEWDLPVEEKLIERVLEILTTVYLGYMGWRAFGHHPHTGGLKFGDTFPQEVLEPLKNAANMMDIDQVTYFLKTHSRMPRDMLQIFRIEYVRKGGALDLTAPLIES